MPTMQDIERQAQTLAKLRTAVAERTQALIDAQEQLKRDHLPGIKRALDKAAAAELTMRELLAESRALFVKPKTVVFHGVQVGYEKATGKIEFTDADAVVALIKKKLPEKAAILIKTTEAPVKKAMAQLTVAELKSIGATVSEDGDRIVVRFVDAALDKLITALLRDALGNAPTEAEPEAEEA
jgi:hypothetical protein